VLHSWLSFVSHFSQLCSSAIVSTWVMHRSDCFLHNIEIGVDLAPVRSHLWVVVANRKFQTCIRYRQWLKYKIWGPGTVSSLGAPGYCRDPMPVVKLSRNAVISIFGGPGTAFRLTLTTGYRLYTFKTIVIKAIALVCINALNAAKA
jgi:hypothetical protein